MWKLISAFVIVQLVCLTFSKELPSNFKKCNRSDPDLNGCLKVAIQDALGLVKDGLPDFKLSPVEPLHVDSMVVGAGTGPVQVVQKFKDIDIHNLTAVILNDVNIKATDTEFTADFDAFNDLITVKSRYELNGKILIFPIVGEGPCTVEMHNLKVKINVAGTGIQKKGETYIRINDVKVSLNPSRLVYNFENLFNGDKLLGDAMNKILNENDLAVFTDVQSGYEEFLAIIFKDIANKIFLKVPYKNLVAV